MHEPLSMNQIPRISVPFLS